jgi:carbon monoxide dehydrogenase subunit G
MIRLSGSTQRSFVLPVEPRRAFAFYRNFERIVQFLPHIHLTQAHNDGLYQVCYDTLELGVYRVKIYCEVQTHYDESAQLIKVSPANGSKLIKGSAGLTSLVCSGSYTSQSRFYQDADGTRIEYDLVLRADAPKPLGLRLVPDPVLDRLANSVARHRMDEIIDTFIQRSLASIA